MLWFTHRQAHNGHAIASKRRRTPRIRGGTPEPIEPSARFAGQFNLLSPLVIRAGRLNRHVRRVAVKPPDRNGRNWPIPGLPGLFWKLTMAGRARVWKVSLPARLRTHALGHKQSAATGSCQALQRARQISSEPSLVRLTYLRL